MALLPKRISWVVISVPSCLLSFALLLCKADRIPSSEVGLTDDVQLKYTVTIREICTTVEKAEVSLIDGH